MCTLTGDPLSGLVGGVIGVIIMYNIIIQVKSITTLREKRKRYRKKKKAKFQRKDLLYHHDSGVDCNDPIMSKAVNSESSSSLSNFRWKEVN